jgi:chromosome partitioning protein
MQTITMASFKGGTGKTTVALHIASALALFHDKRCLLIDSDPQANLSQALGFSPDSLEALPALLQKEKSLKKVIQNTKIQNLDLIQANTFLDQIETTYPLVSSPYSHEQLGEELKSLENKYDYCFIDIPPSLNWLCRSAFFASNFSLIAAIPEPFSILAMKRLSQYHVSINERHPIEVLGIVLSFWDERGAINDGVIDGIEKYFPGKILSTKIRQDKSISRTVIDGLPVYLTDKNSRSGANFKTLTNECLKLLEKKKSLCPI